MASEDHGWARHRAELRDRVRYAKEALSQEAKTDIWIAGLKETHQLTRDQLQALIEDDVNATLTKLETTISDAGLTPRDLAAVYLIGGSSQLPTVADKILERFGIEPKFFAADPKAVVAQGAAAYSPPQVSQWTHRPCRLGARSSEKPGLVDRVEHRLSIGADAVVVRSVPNRWPSLHAFAVEENQRAIGQGVQHEPPRYGSALGVDGAQLFPARATDGQAYWSSYQLIGGWAIHSQWPHDAPGIERIQAAADRTHWSSVRPPLEFAGHDGTEPVETVTVYTRAGRIPVDAVTRAHSEPIPKQDAREWLLQFFWRLQQKPGITQLVQAPEESTFATGAACKVATYRFRGKRARCWYGVVNQRGVSITVEALAPLPPRWATTLRDSIAIFP
jgi:hypothetical protein